MWIIINTRTKQINSGMRKVLFAILLVCITISSFSQEKSSETFLADSSLMHASVSLCVAEAKTGDILLDYNSGISLAPASVMKIITSAAALELLGPAYTFKTKVAYTGSLNKRTGRLKGNIIIIGGGDPSLGSKYFSDHYKDFYRSGLQKLKNWELKKLKEG
jgi:serine-type D-Ala-D-Ala carboxypeptidase/endopeptidase (penicillin-binding protein 4)